MQLCGTISQLLTNIVMAMPLEDNKKRSYFSIILSSEISWSIFPDSLAETAKESYVMLNTWVYDMIGK